MAAGQVWPKNQEFWASAEKEKNQIFSPVKEAEKTERMGPQLIKMVLGWEVVGSNPVADQVLFFHGITSIISGYK